MLFGPFTKGKAEVILRDFKALMVENRCLRESLDGERREMLPKHLSDRLISAKGEPDLVARSGFCFWCSLRSYGAQLDWFS